MKEKDPLHTQIVGNIQRIANDKNVKQSVLADAAGISQSQMSRVFADKVSVSIGQLRKIAECLGVRVIDIITYPDRYVLADKSEDPIDAVVQIKLHGEKKEQVLKLVLGDCEILKQ